MEFEEAMSIVARQQNERSLALAAKARASAEAHRDFLAVPVLDRLEAIEEKLDELLDLARSQGLVTPPSDDPTREAWGEW